MATATEQLSRPMRDGVTSDHAKRICFVCTGNTCRSPMAAAVANALAHAEGISVRADSAGLYAVQGDPISKNAILALEKADVEPVSGMDYHTHTAENLTDEAISSLDLLIPMTRTHAMELILRYPDAVKKIVCMPRQISDPFGGDLRVYQECLAEIVDGVDGLIHISQIAQQRIAKPADVLNLGDVVDAKIIAIDEENRKVSLSIRALLDEAQAEAEAMPAEEVVEEAVEEVAEAAAEEAAEAVAEENN